MGLVENQEGAVPRAHVDESVDGRHVAVHGEHGVGHDDGTPGAGQEAVDGVDVAVGVHVHVAPAEAAAVDDRRVVQLVAADQDVG